MTSPEGNVATYAHALFCPPLSRWKQMTMEHMRLRASASLSLHLGRRETSYDAARVLRAYIATGLITRDAALR